MSSKRGLPATHKMRHDLHFVEELSARSDEAVGKQIPVKKIDANPYQPRATMENIDALAQSISEKGVLAPLIVRPLDNGRYQLVSGERRLRASEKAGLKLVPCIEMDIEEVELLEIALVENIQRKDLTAFEEADGYKMLIDKFGYTHARLSELVGKSRSVVTETLALCELPESLRERCERSGIMSKSMLLQLAREKEEAGREELLKKILSGDLTRREEVKKERGKEKKEKGRPSHYIFKYQPKKSSFSLQLKFKKSRVEKREIIATLKEILLELEENL